MDDYSSLIVYDWNFGDDEVVAKELAQLVLSGEKTATTGLWREGKIISPVGSYEAIVDVRGKRICVIQVVDIQVKPFLKVGYEFIKKEGEGDIDVESWRDKHRKIFHQWSSEFTDKSSVVCEEFRLVQVY